MPESANERFHRMIFVAVQRLRGRPVGAYIRKLQAWERPEPKAFQRLRAERLARTLEYAGARVPLYRSGLWRDASGRGTAEALQSWPALERETIQGSSTELLAQALRRGTMSAARLTEAVRYLQTVRPNLRLGVSLRGGRAGPSCQGGCPAGIPPTGALRQGIRRDARVSAVRDRGPGSSRPTAAARPAPSPTNVPPDRFICSC